METYPRATTENLQALDFTYPAKQNAIYQREMTESPVLDLSVKKEPELTSTESTNVSTFSFCSNSSVNTEKSHEINNYSESECKSPFEGRTFMVTPPSESDSPKKIKYEPLCNGVVLPNNNNAGQYGGFVPVSMNMPIPALPPLLPTVLPHNGAPVPPIQITGVPVSSTTTTTITGNYPRNAPPPSLSPDTGKKAPRPFKAYPKDPLSLSMGPAELIYDQNSTEAYSEFRKRMLDSVRRTNEGTNIKMRRVTKSPGLPTSTVDEKDAAYWERRRKNNEAAKRSRDARRAKEDEIAIRAAFLEQENMKLKYELVALRNETAKLRCMVYST